jgi:hypothetical protein
VLSFSAVLFAVDAISTDASQPCSVYTCARVYQPGSAGMHAVVPTTRQKMDARI